MLIFKNYKLFLKTIIIFQILNSLLITSCTLKNFKDNNILLFNEKKDQVKELIIPEGINIPSKNQKYNIPYTKKELEKENYDIFPPI